MQGLRIEDGVITTLNSLSNFADDIGAQVVLALIHFVNSGGDEKFIAVTTSEIRTNNNGSGAWSDITGGVTWAGGESTPVDHTIGVDATDGDRYVFITNGVNTPVRWGGAGNVAATTLDLANFTTCKSLAIFKDRLVLGGITYTSGDELQQLAWSDAADLEDFTTGTAGALTIGDAVGDISRMEVLGDQLAIFTTTSIHMMANIGGAITMSMRTAATNLGVFSRRCAVFLKGICFFMSREGFFSFDGVSVKEIGKVVGKQLREEIDTANPHQAFAYHHESRERIYWVVPTTDASFEVTYFVMDYNLEDVSQSTWTYYQQATRMSCAGTFKRLTTDKPVFALAGTSQCQELSTDDTTSIVSTARYESVDFTAPEGFQSQRVRWVEVEAELKGDSVTWEYSTDGGATFTGATTQALTTTWTLYRFLVDTSSVRFRFGLKVTATTNGFELRWLRVWGRPGGRAS
tara:strand:- start:507 stop:1889 length:1383 start_codon:yes stop_codon:yes gene_type:complete